MKPIPTSQLKFRYDEKEADLVEVGIDEAGRGCLLGPVFAGAVAWDAQKTDGLAALIKDSKKLSPKKREELATYIEANAIAYGVGSASNLEIDNINILHAAILAMHRAVDQVVTKLIPDHLLVDGDKFKLYTGPDGDVIRHTCVVDGDNKYVCIAAASILAKVHHDRWIKNLLTQDPTMDVYHISTNQGYGSKQHLDAIKKHGITTHHRKSFKCCK